MTQAEFAERIVDMQATLYRVSTSLLPQMADREDAVQQCILKAWQARGRLRSDAAMRAWVVRILINECYAILRGRKRETLTDTLPEREVMPDANEDLYRLFTAMPEKYRLPMILHYVEGYPVRDVATMLRLPQGTVKTRLRRGRMQLKEAMRAEEVHA